ncbi:MAG: hypothetical protein ACXABY_14150 [Candidatus Thorarchaeota archaeon]|jgi:hypothetical protein
MDFRGVTPAIFCKNEEYWIHYVLRDLLKVFDKVIMLDTGSHDDTKRIARETADAIGKGELVLMEEDFGDDPDAIGNSPNILREAVKTHWMLLLAGDEILREEQLLNLQHIHLDTHKYKIGMIVGYNIASVDGKLMWRDEFAADKFFDPTIHWTATEYPFEGYEQHIYAEAGMVDYLPSEFFYWHVRHLRRSSKDDDTYFRGTKADYYPFEGEHKDLPANWLGPVEHKYSNPYWSDDGHNASIACKE